jgi:hypothetical protein
MQVFTVFIALFASLTLAAPSTQLIDDVAKILEAPLAAPPTYLVEEVSKLLETRAN